MKTENAETNTDNNDMGKRKWHRIFGWGTITHPYTEKGSTLFDSDYKHVQQYIQGKGWIDYIGTGASGNITSLHINKNELYDSPIFDDAQSIIHHVVKIIK